MQEDKTPDQNKPGENKKPDEKDNYMKYSSAGFQIVAPVILGVLVGLWLDKHFNRTDALWTIILSSVMIVVALYQFIKQFLKKN
jgi:hypothetical protein